MASPPTADAEARRRIRAWCLYDWANSAFACTVMAAMFPPFFRGLATAAGVPAHRRDRLLGLRDGPVPRCWSRWWRPSSAPSPTPRAARKRLLADRGPDRLRRHRELRADSGRGLAARRCALHRRRCRLRVVDRLLRIAAAAPRRRPRPRRRLRARLRPRLRRRRPPARGERGLGHLAGRASACPRRASRCALSFVSVGVWWALFSLPLLRARARARRRAARRRGARTRAWRTSWAACAPPGASCAATGRCCSFLVAYWIYNDGIGTIVKMATAYGTEIGIGLRDLILALVITQFVGMPGTLAFGRLARRLGARRVLLGGLVVYALICVAGLLPAHGGALLPARRAGRPGAGRRQALSRSLFGSMVPRARAPSSSASSAPAAAPPASPGRCSSRCLGQLTGQSRWAILILTVFFLAGAWLLGRVDLAAGRRRARAEDAAH